MNTSYKNLISLSLSLRPFDAALSPDDSITTGFSPTYRGKALYSDPGVTAVLRGPLSRRQERDAYDKRSFKASPNIKRKDTTADNNKGGGKDTFIKGIGGGGDGWEAIV
ncbi:hypothetical protein SK128_009769 [Halocaridina rubra]|uniref:Uncharacterized protein n=1 Tax=Halocaridina rubra TaxID=373956 RepID=A0AAN8WUM0_HALRR